jgi:L-xylulokinase
MKTNKSYYMGIDNGGTFCKAGVFTSDGAEVAVASRKLEMLTPEPGFTERDMEILWDVNCAAIRDAIDKAGIPGNAIRAVACSGHGKGLYLWGKDNKPCYNGIVSTDNRAWQYPEKWNKDGTADRVFKKTFQKILACQPVSLLCWLKDNAPEVIENIRWIFSVKDYIRFRLTGQAFAEITDYSGSNLMNIKEKRFDRDLLKEFGLEDIFKALPSLKYSHDLCGEVTAVASARTGLKEGVPLAGGMFDIDACAIAMNIKDEEQIAVIGGTWSINEYISKQPVLNKSIMMNSLYCIQGYYLIEECSPTSAGNFEWFVEMFLQEEKQNAIKAGMDVLAYCDQVASGAEPGGNSIIFLPFLFGSNDNPQAKATLIGLDRSHSRGQIIRAVLEGIVFCHKVHLDKLLANREVPKTVRLAGGVASSLVWAHIFSDVFNLPVEIVETKELGALGCAMAAAVATGEYRDLQEAGQSMVRIKCRLNPDPANAAVYKDKFTLYKKVASALEDTWKYFSPVKTLKGNNHV